MPNFSHVSPGKQSSPPPYKQAAWLNAVSDAAAAFNAQAELGRGKSSVPAHSIDRSAVKIKNLTGSDLLRGHYVQLGEFELDAKDPRNLWFEGNLYDEESNQRIGIVTNAVKDGSRVDAVLVGMAVAVVDVKDAEHRYAKPVDGEYVLESADSGPVEILDTVSTTGEQECVVLLGAGGGRARAELAGALAIIKGTVPASSAIDVTGTLTNSSSVVTPGILAVSATANTFSVGALLVNPDGTPVFRTVDESEELYAVDVLNPSYTDFIGEGDGVCVVGTLATWTEGAGEEAEDKEAFLLPNPDHRSLPGFVKGTAPVGDDDEDLQIIYHEGGEDSFKLDSADCAAEE